MQTISETAGGVRKPTSHGTPYSKIGLKREISLLFNEGENFLQLPDCYTT